MPTTVLLRDEMGRPWRITLSGRTVITGEGSSQVIQELDTVAEAERHFEWVLGRRRRDRYTLVEVKEIDDGDPLLKADALGDRAKWDAERRRLEITFKDTADRSFCAAVVDRVVELQPRVLHLLCDPQSPGETFADALLSATLDSVEGLILDTYWQTIARQRRNYFGDLAELFEAMPNLQRAYITGAIKASPFAHSRLRELYLLGDPIPDISVMALADSQLPALEVLGLGLAADTEPAEGMSLQVALTGLAAPKLREVLVDGLGGIVEYLGAGGIPASLRDGGVLALGGEIEDEDALLEALRMHKGALSGLSKLALPLGEAVSIVGDAEARKLVPAVCDSDELGRSMVPDIYLEW